VAQDSWSFHRLIPDVTMVSRDGRPSLGHDAIATSTGIDKLHLKAPRCPGLILSYKRAGPGSTRGNGGRKEQAPANEQTRLQLTDQHLKQSPLYSFRSLETWARFPLSQACNPYASTSVQGNTKLSPPAGRRASFVRTRINRRVFSLHHHPG
jgi:hypothetical protein